MTKSKKNGANVKDAWTILSASFLPLGRFEFRHTFLISIFASLLFTTTCPAETDRLSTLAGSANPGFQEGSRGRARFHWPSSLTLDTNKNIYIADSHNHVIRKLTPTGVSSTVAGLAGQPGSANGSGTNAQFNAPQGIASDHLGNLYVADTGNHVIRKITPDGTVSLFAGVVGDPGNVNGAATNARFHHPQALTVDKANNLFVADTWNHLIRKITSDGTASTLAGLAGIKGSTDSTNSKARFHWPSGIAVDNAGNLFVTDHGSHIVRKMSPIGTNWQVSTIAGFPGLSGDADGIGSTARFFEPQGTTVDNAGNIYVIDSGNQTLRMISPGETNWITTTLFGMAGNNGSANGVGNVARLNWPAGIALDSDGYLYIADAGNSSIRLNRVISPVLQTSLSASEMTMSWSILDAEFALETSSDFSADSWTPLTNGIARSGDDYVFTNNVNNGGRLFYRLRLP